MQKVLTSILFLIVVTTTLVAQTPTPTALLDKSITYHDPNNQWTTWQAEFMVELEMKDRPNRISRVNIDNQEGNFYLIVQRDGHTIERGFRYGECQLLFDRKEPTDKEAIKKYQLNCERNQMYRNYYTYLYGLPMKLKDKGTQLDKVEAVSFQGEDYWRLRVTYDADVGSDIWYFYFDQVTYALEAYQFYHDETKNDGEYILLNGEATISGIRIPKDRTWYMNQDDKLLGTDFLKVIR